MHQKNYILCYDIKNSKRLQKVQRRVSNTMLRVQYSVYYATLYPKDMDVLIKDIDKIIHHHDEVTVYEVEPLEEAFLVGGQLSQVMLFSQGGKRLWR